MADVESPELLMMGPMHPVCMAALARDYRVHRWWEAPDRDALLAGAGARIRAVATDGHLGCPEHVLARLPALEIIASYGVGYDAIPVALARTRGIRVTNTPDVLNDAVAELTIGLMLALTRRIVEADRFVREGAWATRAFGLTGELSGGSVGILGLGRIGKEIARRCEAMKLRVVYHGRTRQEGVPWRWHPDLAEMAAEVDWLVAIAPGTAATKGIVSRRVLEALGPQGRFLNISRGSLVDEAALIELLEAGRLAGAALDVFATEPRPDPRLLALPNVVLSPHQGSATERTRAAMGDLVVRNLAAHFAGRPLISEVTG